MNVCKVCGKSLKISTPKAFDARYGYPDYFDILYCPNCGLFQTHPPLTQDDIGPLYSNYYPYADIDPEKIKTGFQPELENKAKLKNWIIGNHRIQNMLPQGTGKILEVGCGDGRSLLQLKALGYEAYGIEADKNIEPIKNALGLNIHIGTIENAPFEPKTFDIVTANQLIEHIVDLNSFITYSKKFLKDGGILILSTPNANSLYRLMFGQKWINWHIPFHQQVFTLKSLKNLLEKNGLKIFKSKTVTPTSWTLHQLDAFRHPSKIGVKNPYWMIKKATSNNQRSIKQNLFKKFILKIIVGIITLVNRIIDSLYLGDCLVVYIK